MPRKLLSIAKRDFIASIRTKAFLLGLVIAPLMFGGSFIGMALMKRKPDIAERTVAIVDHTGLLSAAIVEAAQQRNAKDLIDKATGRQMMPVYRFEVIPPAADAPRQRLALSNRVRRHELFAFAEIGANALQGRDGILWYSNESALGEGRRWLSEAFNEGTRRVRLAQLGVYPADLSDVLAPVPVESMNLVAQEGKTGRILPEEKKQDLAGAIPFGLTILMAMIVMLTSAPMLPAIAEDKMQRVFEMLLASATPFELIAGKVLAAVGRSLVSSVFYIVAGVLVINALATIGLAPFALLPWFVIYLVAEVTILSAFAAALGAACGSPQDAQSLGVVLVIPVMLPLFLMVPVLQQPNSTLATAISLTPPFTPMLMLLRQSMPGGVPGWQPWAGLAGVLLTATAVSWIAARVFRVTILLQGKAPNLAELARWAVRG